MTGATIRNRRSAASDPDGGQRITDPAIRTDRRRSDRTPARPVVRLWRPFRSGQRSGATVPDGQQFPAVIQDSLTTQPPRPGSSIQTGSRSPVKSRRKHPENHRSGHRSDHGDNTGSQTTGAAVSHSAAITAATVPIRIIGAILPAAVRDFRTVPDRQTVSGATMAAIQTATRQLYPFRRQSPPESPPDGQRPPQSIQTRPARQCRPDTAIRSAVRSWRPFRQPFGIQRQKNQFSPL